MLTVYPAYDAENEALFIADTIEKILRQYPDRRWRSCTAPTRNRGRLKKRCAATTASTTWSAASATTSAPKSKTSRVSEIRAIADGFDQPAAHHQYAGARHRQDHRGSGRAVRGRKRPQPLGRDRGACSMRNQFGTRAHSAMQRLPRLIEELAEAVAIETAARGACRSSKSAPATGAMLEQENTPESQARLENLNELMNAAARSGGARRNRAAIFWITRRWSRRPTRSTKQRRSR